MVLKIRTGSHLYGANIENSDEDFVTIFIPHIDSLVGLNKTEVTESVSETEDVTSYSLEKFVRLALNNNPNIIDCLFANQENIKFSTPIGKELISLRQQFLCKNIKYRFNGYAFSQKKKMIIKKDNYNTIHSTLEALKDERINKKLPLLYIVKDFPKINIKVSTDKSYMRIGDINFNSGTPTKKVIKTLEDRVRRYGDRYNLISKFRMYGIIEYTYYNISTRI